MEKGPDVRIVGGAPIEKKEWAKEKIAQAFFDHFESLSLKEQEQLVKFEYPKSKKDIALIDFANQETSRLMQESGVEGYNVPAENFHIIPSDFYRNIAGNEGAATTFNIKQGIIFDAQDFHDNPVNFGAVAIHELLHLKAHFSLEVQDDGDKVGVTPYREGVAVRAVQSHGYHGKYHVHFAGLSEGIVAETEKRLLGRLLECPALRQEKEWLNSDEAREMKIELATKKNIPEDDIVWIGKKGEDDWATISYLPQRKVLNYVCVEIQKEFPDQYQSPDDVYKEFLNAHFTGKLLLLARLMEKTFGEGSFRLLGNMSTEKRSGVLHLESLKKARSIIIRK